MPLQHEAGLRKPMLRRLRSGDSTAAGVSRAAATPIDGPSSAHHVQLEALDLYPVRSLQDDGPLDDTLELADVAGPRMGSPGRARLPERILGDPGPRPGRTARRNGEPTAGCPRRRALSGGTWMVNHAHAVEQVAPEGTVFDHPGEIPGRRRDHPYRGELPAPCRRCRSLMRRNRRSLRNRSNARCIAGPISPISVRKRVPGASVPAHPRSTASPVAGIR